MAIDWVCGECRSINRAASGRCYSCGGSRSAGEMTEASVALAAATLPRAQTAFVRASRSGARYVPTWPLALALVPLILVVTGLFVSMAGSLIRLIGPDGFIQMDKAATVAELDTIMWLGIAGICALLAWSLWIAMVVRNLPALTAAWPAHGPVRALFAAWIPIVQWWWPYTIMRDVFARLTAGRRAPSLLALAWWLSLLGAYWGPVVYEVVALVRRASVGEVVANGLRLETVLVVAAGLLAATLVVVTEGAQRRALKARAAIILADAEIAGAPAVTPSA